MLRFLSDQTKKDILRRFNTPVNIEHKQLQKNIFKYMINIKKIHKLLKDISGI